MRITVLSSSYPRFNGDGTAPFVKSICEEFEKLGNKVDVVAPYDPLVEDQFLQKINIHRFKYTIPKSWHILGHANSLIGDATLKLGVYFLLPFFLVSAFIKLLRIARNQDAQLIHAHWVLPNGFPAVFVSKLLKIPLVVTLHGSDIFLANKNWVFRKIARFILINSSFVSACSPELMKKAVLIGCTKNIRLIPWGADPQKFHKKEVSKNEYGFQNIKRGGINLIALGRLVHKKGFSNLILAMPNLIACQPNLSLLIGGDGELRDQLEDLVNKLNLKENVFFLGRINWNKVVDFLSIGDIFIQPSIIDQFGNEDGLPTVILEAMACSLPIVASDIGGTSLVVKNEFNGILVQPGDVGELLNGILSLVNNPHKLKVMGNNSRDLIENTFNWTNIAKDFQSEFNKIITLS